MVKSNALNKNKRYRDEWWFYWLIVSLTRFAEAVAVTQAIKRWHLHMWYMEDRNRNFSLAVFICIKLCRSVVWTYTCCALWCAEALLCLSLVVSCKLCLSRFSICNSRCRRYQSMVNLAEDTFWAESVELSDLSQGLAHPGNKVELFSGLNYFSWDQFSSRLYRHLSISSMVENHLSGFAEICSALVHRHSCWYIEY